MTSIALPEEKRFAFTVFDDPDGATGDARCHVYPLLRDLGFKTTRAVWPIGPLRGNGFQGETCANAEYRDDARQFQQAGFELAYHNAAPHTCTRDEIIKSLEVFRDYFGRDPVSMANHMDNGDSIYWGDARVSGIRSTLYNAMTRGHNANRFFGHVDGSPHFWGDICRERIQYCRNFVFRELNTLAACPLMPYHDERRPYVREWFSSADGTDCATFNQMVSERNQDQLEAEGGLSILYTHFGKGFVENGALNPEFKRLMTRLSRKNGWFVPTSTMLDYLRQRRGPYTITDAERRRLEWKWLLQKSLRGTS